MIDLKRNYEGLDMEREDINIRLKKKGEVWKEREMINIENI